MPRSDIADLAEITVTPEVWIKGVQVVAAEYGLAPYVLKRRRFIDGEDEAAALAAFDAMCSAGMSPQKAYRVCLCDGDEALDASRARLLERLGL